MSNPNIGEQNHNNEPERYPSVLPLHEQEEVRKLAIVINRLLVVLNRKYLTKEDLQKQTQSPGIEERIHVVDKDTFDSLWFEQFTEAGDFNHAAFPGNEVLAFFLKRSNIIVSKSYEEYWEKILPNLRDELIEKFGKENSEKTKEVIGKIFFINTLAHEIAHLYQNSQMPQEFLEIGARYYEKQVVSRLGIYYLPESLDEERIKFYEELIVKYGDDVHKLFFGTPVDKDIGIGILSETMDEASRLFPDNMGLAHPTVVSFDSEFED